MMTIASKSIQTESKKPNWWQRQSVCRRIWRVFVYATLISVALVIILPLYWLVLSSLKFEPDLFKFPPQWIPSPATMRNYGIALSNRLRENVFGDVVEDYSFIRNIRNSLTIIIANMIFGVSISALVAYALARLRVRGRDLIFYSVIGALFIPGVVFLVPRFVIFASLI